jgi:hypothetical protein
MIGSASTTVTAFEGSARVGTGALRDVAMAIKTAQERRTSAVLVFEDVTSHQVDVDTRGTKEQVLQRLVALEPNEGEGDIAVVDAPVTDVARGPGRPKLGVVAREITLLPRHWEWLATQSGGASVAIRKLVDEAKKQNEARDRARFAQESAYRFISVMAGNLPGFEEASRALFANNAERFAHTVAYWPKDVREHAVVLASRAFGTTRFQPV